MKRCMKKLRSSYRTYEEWKLAACHSANSFINSSYRTYEEWKPRIKAMPPAEKRVLTVPMRNGNIDTTCFSLQVVVVLTVPMRNGNSVMLSLVSE